MRSPRSSQSGARRAVAQPRRVRLPWRDIMDVLALGTWSAMLLRYWLGGKLLLLLHPNYAWISNVASIVLLLLAGLQAIKIGTSLWGRGRPTGTKGASQTGAGPSHVTLMPPNLSSALLLSVAVFGLIYTPRAFASQTAIQRGISDTLTLTRAQPQRFVRAASPEERTIIDWIRLINVYPEPDEYRDESVNVKGFVIRPEGWPKDYLMVSRFVLTCCAADAYPVGLPVKLTDEAFTDKDYPVDSWLEVSGTMTTETLDNRRQVAIVPTAIVSIEEPDNPYEY